MSDLCSTQIVSEDYADFIVEFGGDVESIQKKYQTDCVQVVDSGYAIFHAPVARMENIGQFAYNTIPKLYGLMDTTNMDAAGIIRVQQQPYLALKGSGVLVGIIDTGIDYQHPAFLNADNTTRIDAIWDQTIESEQTLATVGFGTEYLAEDIDRALASEHPLEIVPSVDTEGHGTFLAGIAAGNTMLEDDFTGAAPNASIAVVKLKPAKQYLREYYLVPDGVTAYQENDIMLAIRYLRYLAMRLQKPISILIGVGTASGEHNGLSYLSTFMNRIGDLSGICFSAPCGNEANRGTHYSGRLEAEGEYEDVEIRVDASENGFIMELWGRAPDVYSIGILSPGGERIDRIQPRYGQIRTVDFLLEPTKIFVQYHLVEGASGNQVIIMRFQAPTPGIWTLRVYGDRLLFKGYNIWLPISDFISEGTYFLRPDPNITITSPGDTLNCVNGAAYNHNNGSIYIQSGRGYTPEGRVVPDIAAPGVNIFGPRPGGGFTRRTGTSVAAAHIAGAGALLLEWGMLKGKNLNMDATEVKKMLIRGARRRSGIVYPNPIWGFGELDLYNVFLYTAT